MEETWSSIKFKCIHPLLLTEVVEPLGVIPETHMIAAFRHQAVMASEGNVMKWESGENDLDITILENGMMVRCAPNPNLDKMSVVFGSLLINHGLCEWDVLVEGPCFDVSIGLREVTSRFSSNTSMDRWLNSSGQLLINEKVQAVNYCTSFEDAQRCEIRVGVDNTLHTCVFTINGKECGIAWSDICREVRPALLVASNSVPINIRIKQASDLRFW